MLVNGYLPNVHPGPMSIRGIGIRRWVPRGSIPSVRLPGVPAAQRRYLPGTAARFRLYRSEPSEQRQDDDNQENEPQTPTRVIAPAAAIWPGRQRPQQQENQDNQQDRAHT